jgi:hypothetical protein
MSRSFTEVLSNIQIVRANTLSPLIQYFGTSFSTLFDDVQPTIALELELTRHVHTEIHAFRTLKFDYSNASQYLASEWYRIRDPAVDVSETIQKINHWNAILNKSKSLTLNIVKQIIEKIKIGKLILTNNIYNTTYIYIHVFTVFR